jgi:ribose-phosphate pyrophosphokinase
MKILSCNSNRPLAEAIAAYLDVPLTKADVRRFADMEVFVEIGENVRGEDVFVIQSTCFPANDNVMELLVALDALRRGSARRITAVLPYYGYARQDRKSGPRTPISAKLLANLITSAGADRVLTIDLHAGQIQGFFDIPTDNLFAAPVFIEDIRSRYDNGQVMIVSPDVGGVVRARSLASRLDADLAIMVDDIVDSGGTLCNAAAALIEAGALSVDAYVTHGVLSGGAVSRVAASPLNSLVTTDSIPATEAVRVARNVRHLSVAPLLGEAIKRINEERSVSTLF